MTLSFPEQDVQFRQITGNSWFELDLELRQPLFTWLKLRNAVRLAELAKDSAAVELQETYRRVRKETAETYCLAVLARESADRLGERTRILEEIEVDRRAAHELGAINLQGLLEIRSRGAEAAQRLIEARESEATALAGLAVLTGWRARSSGWIPGFPRRHPVRTQCGSRASARSGPRRWRSCASSRSRPGGTRPGSGEGVLPSPTWASVWPWRLRGKTRRAPGRAGRTPGTPT